MRGINPIANPEIVLREEFDDWALLFNPDTGDAYGINPTSVFIWRLLDGKQTKEDIVNKIQANCEEVPSDVDKHVDEFLADLAIKGYVGYEDNKL